MLDELTRTTGPVLKALDPQISPAIPIAAGVLLLGLALMVARRAAHRRRIARLERRREESRINVSRGTLATAPLPDLMRALADYRSSGMLELVAPTESFALYFLFGRIFHATGSGLEGEAALGRALRLPDALYHFDTKTRLPRQMTITDEVVHAVREEAVR
ncbi:MAG: DUF4388 domain-containing protein [Candidatus Dormibacteraeota bacterium]|nr:DUF4388 domain-containing protein [Candidatus Dormibacteraeota bacterium]